MSFHKVKRWRDLLRTLDPAEADTGLSPQGVRAVWALALNALSDEVLRRIQASGGQPYPTATVVCARTVVTAPIEWCAVLLGRGSQVTLKHPTGDPALTSLLARAAQEVGLPLTHTADRGAAQRSELVVAMGTDRTAQAVTEAAKPGAKVLAFGHRFSAAYVHTEASLQALATDAAMHDGRGCMSPVAVFTDHPHALEVLAEAMAQAEARWPRGHISTGEAAAIRSRGALARVLGAEAHGAAWSLHQLPLARFRPMALPRSLVVHPVGHPDQVRAALAPHRRHMSGLATQGEDLGIPEAREVRPGQMQAPALERLHDGVDWIAETSAPTDAP